MNDHGVWFPENWKEMTERHRREKLALIKECNAAKLTIKQACEVLGITEPALYHALKRNNLRWHSGIRPKKVGVPRRRLAPEANANPPNERKKK